jgi:hypothetical protein
MEGFEYSSEFVSAADLAAEFEKAFRQTDGWDLIKKRLPEGTLPPEQKGLPLSVKPEAEGIDPATATIVVAVIAALSPVVKKIVLDLWSEVWLPRIKSARGENVVKPVRKK